MRTMMSGPVPGGCETTIFTGRAGQPCAKAGAAAAQPARSNAARPLQTMPCSFMGLPPWVILSGRIDVASAPHRGIPGELLLAKLGYKVLMRFDASQASSARERAVAK
jgi:hypothetical protein